MTTSLPRSLLNLPPVIDIGDYRFGVVGDGAADDTVAVQAAFDYVKTNGGVLCDMVGRTFKIGSIVLGGGAKPWRFHGVRGATKFVRKDDTVGTPLNCAGSAVQFELHDFMVDCKHSVYPNGNHGVAIGDTAGVRVKGVDVVDWKNTGIIMYATVPNTYGDCVVEDCTAVSAAAVANNGILIANMPRSGIVRSNAKGATGSPGIGIQLKNDSRYGFITDCYAENCAVGLGFGVDNASSAVKYSQVKGMRILNCVTGFNPGYAERNHITGLFIDMGGANNNAMDIQTSSFGNYINAIVVGVAASKAAARIRTTCTDNTIDLELLDLGNLSGKAAIFDAGSARNLVRVARVTNPSAPTGGPMGLATDSSTTSDNIVTLAGQPVYQSITIAADAITIGNPTTEMVIVDTEAAAATDNLSTISGPTYEGKLLCLRTTSNVRDVTVKHNIGNILLNGLADYTLDAVADTLELRYNSNLSKWCEVGRGNNT
jgi:hypothetical protein